MKYELKHHGFVHQFGYDVWEILENGTSIGTLYPGKEAAQKTVDFYNGNNISREEYRDLILSDPQKALLMNGEEFYEKYKHLIEDRLMKSTVSQMKINPELPDKILLRGSTFNNSAVYISKEELVRLFQEGWSLKDLVGYGTQQDDVSYLIEAKKLLDEIKERF